MRPDQRWFPTSRTDRASWFGNFSMQFANVGLSLGFTQAEIDAVAADNDIVQFLNATIVTTGAYATAIVSFQQTLLMGKCGAVTPDLPALQVSATPLVPPTGVFERLERLVRRIRVSPAYTDATGAQLGILPRQASRPDLATVKPAFKVLPSTAPFSFTVKVAKRSFKAYIVVIQRQSSEDWENAGFFTSSPVNITVEPSAPNTPEVIRVRLRMVTKNDPVGQYSDLQIVTVSP